MKAIIPPIEIEFSKKSQVAAVQELAESCAKMGEAQIRALIDNSPIYPIENECVMSLGYAYFVMVRVCGAVLNGITKILEEDDDVQP